MAHYTSEQGSGPHSTQVLTVTLEPLDMGMEDGGLGEQNENRRQEMEDERSGNDRMEDGETGNDSRDSIGNEELSWQWPHSTPISEVPSPQADDISIDVSNF